MKTVLSKIFSFLLLAMFLLTMSSCEKSEFADLEDPTFSARSFDDGGEENDGENGSANGDDITDDEDDDEDDGDITDDEDDDEDDTTRSLDGLSNSIK